MHGLTTGSADAGTARLSRNVRPTAGGRANGVAGEPRWLRPPTAAEPADGTDGPAGHGSPATPFGAYGGSPPKRGRHLCNKTEET